MGKKPKLKPYEKTWRTNEGLLAFKTYLKIGNLLSRVDVRVGDSDSYGVIHVFSGGWVMLAEADGSMLKSHKFKPGDDEQKTVAAMRLDAMALAEEANLVMAFGATEGMPQDSEEDDLGKKRTKEGDKR